MPIGKLPESKSANGLWPAFKESLRFLSSRIGVKMTLPDQSLLELFIEKKALERYSFLRGDFIARMTGVEMSDCAKVGAAARVSKKISKVRFCIF